VIAFVSQSAERTIALATRRSPDRSGSAAPPTVAFVPSRLWAWQRLSRQIRAAVGRRCLRTAGVLPGGDIVRGRAVVDALQAAPAGLVRPVSRVFGTVAAAEETLLRLSRAVAIRPI
jgi:hypothetical protein